MKKLLFVVAASFFSGAVYAQVESGVSPYNDLGTRGLHCTEEAVSFRVNILPGGQLGSFKLGYADFANSAAGFNSSKNSTSGTYTTDPLILAQYQNATNRQESYTSTNLLLPAKSIESLAPVSPFNLSASQPAFLTSPQNTLINQGLLTGH
jgi:hypothetical protein